MRISATIVTLNEERNIARAVESVRGVVTEVVVVDSGSSDRTVEIAERLGARVIHNAWPGYAAQKNFAAAAAENDWILSIDADEELTPALREEIAGLGFDVDGYSMPRLARYLGKWIRHSGWYPDRKVRLYRRGRAQWVGEHVHESVEVRGSVGALQNDLLHYTCDSLAEHRRTLDRYTTLAAQGARRRGWVYLTLSPAWTFVRSYLVQRGFLDGWQGLTIARMAALYTFRKYSKARHANPAS